MILAAPPGCCRWEVQMKEGGRVKGGAVGGRQQQRHKNSGNRDRQLQLINQEGGVLFNWLRTMPLSDGCVHFTRVAKPPSLWHHTKFPGRQRQAATSSTSAVLLLVVLVLAVCMSMCTPYVCDQHHHHHPPPRCHSASPTTTVPDTLSPSTTTTSPTSHLSNEVCDVIDTVLVGHPHTVLGCPVLSHFISCVLG